MTAPNESTVTEASPESTRRLGHYTLLSELAHGGMSRVYLARQDGSSELCVVKQLKDDLAAHEAIEKRFEREAALCALLQHPNIARIFESGSQAGAAYIAMELIAGHTIAEIMREVLTRRALIPAEISVAIALRVLEALAYAHDATGPDRRPLELVHRDLSPRNVMVSYFGDVKVIDFGLARGNIGDFRTRPGQLLGTLRYVSPEQARGEPVDRRTDVYSTAVVLYEMLAGRALFRSDQPVKTLRAVVYDPPPPIESFAEGAPLAARQAVLKAMSKKAEDRYATAELFAAELRAAFPAAVDIEPATIGHYLMSLFPEPAKRLLELVRMHESAVKPTDLSPEGSKTAITDVTSPDTSAPEIEDPTPTAHTQPEPDLEVSTPLVHAAIPEVQAAPTKLLDPKPRSRRRRKEVERLERQLRRWRNIAIITALVALCAVTALITSSTTPAPQADRTQPEPVQAPPIAAKPAIEPRPVEEPPAEPPAAETEEASKPAKRPRPAKKAIEAPPAERNTLADQLAALRADPRNVALFEHLVETIEARAAQLPKDRRATITSLLNAASISGEVEGLSRALQALEREEAR